MTPWFNMMSSITMLDPSSDLFTGFYDFKPYSRLSENNNPTSRRYWYEVFVVSTFPWDAGTETDDKGFDTDNPEEVPRVPIQRAAGSSSSAIVAGWVCELIPNSQKCVDHTLVTENGKHRPNCKRIRNAPTATKFKKRCNRRFKGRRMFHWCPASCGKCSPNDQQVVYLEDPDTVVEGPDAIEELQSIILS